ncbi:MAG: hypothetical protein WD022_02645 [Balneolaceae bacterium]
MTKLISTILLVTFISIPIYAQESIGFSDSTDFQYIIDYQLPDWGYSNFYISTGRFQSNNDYRNTNQNRYFTNPVATVSYDEKRESHNTTISISPSYQYYRQSEKQILSLNTNLYFSSGFRSNSTKLEGSTTNDAYDLQERDSDSKLRGASASYIIDLNTKYYVRDDVFLSVALDGDINFTRQDSETIFHLEPERDRDEEEFSRNILFYPRLGIGLGRVRNVAPQIRAIRLKERYQQISDQSFTNDEIIESAEQFTRIQQYKSTRDRHQKYFWGDMNELLSGKLDEVAAYDLFYLNDVLNENLGQRYEGFDIRINGIYRYTNSLRRDETTLDGDTQLNRNISINRLTGTSSRLRLYKNLSLNHQLSFIAEYELVFPLEKSHNIKYDTDIFADFSWLWTITDRYLLTTSLRNYYSKPVYKDRITDSDQFTNDTYLTGSFSYFIENKLSLTGSLSAKLGFYEQQRTDATYDTNQIRWSAAVNVRYYFARNLF